MEVVVEHIRPRRAGDLKTVAQPLDHTIGPMARNPRRPTSLPNNHLDDMWISVVGISNDFEFRDNLSPKVKDTLCDEEIHFSPYDAHQLRSILSRRAEEAFREDALHDDVIPLCAAFAAQDKGSARQAIQYLYKAGELAANNGNDVVTEPHVQDAEEVLEQKSIEKGIATL